MKSEGNRGEPWLFTPWKGLAHKGKEAVWIRRQRITSGKISVSYGSPPDMDIFAHVVKSVRGGSWPQINYWRIEVRIQIASVACWGSHVENYYQIIKKKCPIFLNPLAFQLTFTKENVPLSPIVFDKDWSNSLSLKRIYNTLFDSDFYLYLNFISIRNCLN